MELRINELLTTTGPICAALIDSENISPKKASKLARQADSAGAKIILVGGSTAIDQIELDKVVRAVKRDVTSLVILFPGNVSGISPSADAIFFSSLMNSDNPYFITEAQALGALAVKKYQLPTLPMANLIIGEGGSAGFVGRSRGIPPDKPSLASMYALAAQYLGMRFLYLEAGSGADGAVPTRIIEAVRNVYEGILLVGGGIRSAETASKIAKAGADILVVGNLLEQPKFQETLRDISRAVSHK